MSEEDEATKLFRIRKTLLEMLIDRGYLVGSNETEQTLEEFKQAFSPGGAAVVRENLTLVKRLVADPSKQIAVFFPEDVKVGVKPIRKYYDAMTNDAINRAILVTRGPIGSFARQTLAKIAQDKNPKFIEVFSEADLLVNITKHVLVPRHILLKAEEKRELLARYKLKESQLPRMTLNDPIARYYGLERGQVVKIIRTSETAGRYTSYRLVA